MSSSTLLRAVSLSNGESRTVSPSNGGDRYHRPWSKPQSRTAGQRYKRVFGMGTRRGGNLVREPDERFGPSELTGQDLVDSRIPQSGTTESSRWLSSPLYRPGLPLIVGLRAKFS